MFKALKQATSWSANVNTYRKFASPDVCWAGESSMNKSIIMILHIANSFFLIKILIK